MRTFVSTLLTLFIAATIAFGQTKENEEIVALRLEKIQSKTQYKIDSLTNSAEKCIHLINAKGQDSMLLIKRNSKLEITNLQIEMHKELNVLKKKYENNPIGKTVKQQEYEKEYQKLEQKYERKSKAMETKYDSKMNIIAKKLELEIDSVQNTVELKIAEIQDEYNLEAAKLMEKAYKE